MKATKTVVRGPKKCRAMNSLEARLSRMKGTLLAIAMDAGLPIQDRPDHPLFDAEMTYEMVLMAFNDEPDRDELIARIDTYRAKIFAAVAAVQNT